MPANLLGVALCRARLDVPQVACFDTGFHHAMPELARRLPVPPTPGLRRYGFHGISYAHVAARLPAELGDAAQGRVVVAHLGAGASLCLLEGLKSMDTTMGYTPAGGVPMATRSGDLDPGVMLELARRHDPAALADLVNHGMGLLALSDGESGDMRELLASDSAGARFAVEYFCYQLRGAIGAMAARAGGIDALVFTGGIGENAPEIRARICAPLAFLGIRLDAGANQANAARISAPGSRPVLRLVADEAAAMRDLVAALLEGPATPRGRWRPARPARRARSRRRLPRRPCGPRPGT
jgi:acetate kinase